MRRWSWTPGVPEIGIKALKIGSLFSGIGGFDLAFVRAGFDLAWSCEVDEQCQMVLRRHFPGVPIHGDITKLDPKNLEWVDVITLGSPCVDLSVAGKRGGIHAERSGLFFEAMRIIAQLQPRYCLWENVPGVFSSYSGCVPTPDELLAGGRGGDEDSCFWTALDAIRECGCTEVGWATLDSRWHGVPQRRRRVFAIGDFGGERTAEILAIPYSLSGHPAPGGKAREEVAGTLSARTEGGGGLGTALECQGGLQAQVVTHPPEHACALAAGKGGSKFGSSRHNQDTFVFKPSHFTRGKDGAPSDVTPPLSADADKGGQEPIVVAFNARQDPGVSGDVAEPLSSSSPQQQAVAFHENQRAEISLSDTHGSLKTGGGKPGQDYPAVMHAASFETRVARNGRGAPSELVNALKSEAGKTGKGDAAPCVVQPIYQCQGSNVGEMGTLKGDDVQRGVPFTFQERGGKGGRVAEVSRDADLAGSLNNPGAGGRRQENNIVTGMIVRRLVPTECEALQNFPRDWTAWGLGVDGKRVDLSDSFRYRSLGNAVTVSTVFWIASRLALALKGDEEIPDDTPMEG